MGNVVLAVGGGVVALTAASQVGVLGGRDFRLGIDGNLLPTMALVLLMHPVWW